MIPRGRHLEKPCRFGSQRRSPCSSRLSWPRVALSGSAPHCPPATQVEHQRFAAPFSASWYIRQASLVVVVSLLIFAVMPTYTVRPLLSPANEAKLDDDLTSWVYQRMVAVDEPPANAAPSLHVSLSCLLA